MQGLIFRTESKSRAIGEAIVKQAASKPTATYSLAGRLYKSDSGWILLSVPNALVRGAFDALDEQGIELPPGMPTFNAHISVMRQEELDEIGGADKITERGHSFKYQLGKVKTVSPAGWKEMSKVWFVEVKSPELEKFRKSYGLSGKPNNGEFEFHITIAVRRTKVLQKGEVSKAALHKTAIWPKGLEHGYGKPPKPAPIPASAVNQPAPPKKLPAQQISKLPRGVRSQLSVPGNKGVAHPTQVTPASALAPYYQNIPGGLAGAAQKATAYNKQYAGPGQPMDLSRKSLTTPRTEYGMSSKSVSEGTTVPGNRASGWSAIDKPIMTLALEARPGYKAITREHELTHQLQTGSTVKPFQEKEPYYSSPTEIDAHFAGPLKRIYARLTGKLVTTPEEAAEAMKYMETAYPGEATDELELAAYYARNKPKKPKIDEQSPAELGKLKKEDELWQTVPADEQRQLKDNDRILYQRLNALPPSTQNFIKEYLKQRMPGVVSNQTQPAATKTAEGNQAADLPWRDRVEMYGLNNAGQVLGGIYDEDKTHGVFGGGVDAGEDPAAAGARELLEESGYSVSNPSMLPVDPITTLWNPPYISEAQAGRAEKYRGSRTQFATGTVSDDDPVTAVDPSGLHDIRYRSLADAIKLSDPDQAAYAEVAAKRREALQYLLAQRQKQAYTPEPRDEWAEGLAQGDVRAFVEYMVQWNLSGRDSGELGDIPDEEVTRLKNAWKKLTPKEKLKYHRYAKCAFTLPWLKEAKKKKREQPAGYIKETEKIKVTREGKGAKPHKFQSAEWTHPNGHPRCKLCGDEERIDGQCDGYKEAAAPYWQQAGMAQFYDPSFSTGRGVMGNIADNFVQAQERGQRMVTAQDTANDMVSSKSTDAALQRMQNFLANGDHVKNPVDQVLFRPLPRL